MGHLANYAIRRDGVTTLFASHWGALSVVRDVFFGPVAAEAFVRGNEPVDLHDGWYDDIFGEGGATLDFDARVLTLFGGELPRDEPWRSVALRLLGTLWPEWTVVWAEVGMPDLAAAVGLDRGLATAPFHPPTPWNIEGLLASSSNNVTELLLVVRPGVPVEVRTASGGVEGLLRFGPELLERVDGLPTVARAEQILASAEYPRTLARALWGGVVVDVGARTLTLTSSNVHPSPRDDALVRWLAGRWPGYTARVVDRHGLPGLLEQMGVSELAGAPPAPEERPLAEILSDIEEEVLGERSDPAEWFRTQTWEPGTWTNPRALRSAPAASLSAEERARLFRWAVAATLSSRERE